MSAPTSIDPNSAVYATDEYGRPFIIVREGQKKSRLTGIEAIRVSGSRKFEGICQTHQLLRSTESSGLLMSVKKAVVYLLKNHKFDGASLRNPSVERVRC